ncbi:MAG: FAD:protein FMN transferase [Opitutus sp.]
MPPDTSKTVLEFPGDAATGLHRLAFAALGTKCMVQYATENGARAAEFEREAVGWVQAFEAKYSRFKPDSLVSRINAAAGRSWVEVDGETERLLTLCDILFSLTHGIMDPSALPLIKLWDYKVAQPVIPSPEQLAGALLLIGWKKVRRERGRIFLPMAGMALDFGGFGKEYAVDIVAQIAVEHGIGNVLVDFGHDIRALGRPPGRPCWHVGLEDPKNPGRHDGSMGLTCRGVASSGDYLRCFVLNGRRYGHIIDPRTGWPVSNGCTQVTVVADSCLNAGVLSTTAFVLGVQEGLEFIQGFPGAEAIFSTATTRAQTRGFFKYVVAP